MSKTEVRLITVDEAAVRASVHRNTLYRAIRLPPEFPGHVPSLEAHGRTWVRADTFPDESMLSVADVVVLRSSLARQDVYAAVYAQQLPCRRVNQSMRFKRVDVEKWLESQE